MKYLVFAFFATCMATDVSAHPHSWITLETTAIINDKSEVTALKQRWTFDQYYTEFVLHDFMPEVGKNPTPEALKKLALENLKNLKAYDFFTTIEAGTTKAKFGAVSGVRSVLYKGQITMEFMLPLEQPLDAKNNKVKYRVFDPSYYVEMLHDKLSYVHIENAGTSSCTTTLEQPKPDMTQTTLAASLDKQATAPANLGESFAQTVTVSCL